MSAWFHWIGKGYYTIKAFQKEAISVGVSRRVSLKVLRQIEWGDTVMCLQCEYRVKAGAMFLEFPVEIITGLSQDAQWLMVDKFEARAVDFGCAIVHRGCGEYMTGLTYRIDAPITKIADVLEEAVREGSLDIGKPMIGCYPDSVKLISEPFPRLKDVPFRQGFRKYDKAAVLNEIDSAMIGGKRPILRGQFYVQEETEQADAEAGDVQTALNYKKKGGG